MSSAKRGAPMVPPINCIYNYLHHQTSVTFWLYEQVHIRIRGKIRGFDEFMNIVIDDAYEVPVDPKTGKEFQDKATSLGRIMLKGDNITMVVAN